MDRRRGIAAGFEAEGDLAALPEEVQLVTYRVAQEAVTNVIQHAQAEHMRVRLIGAGATLELRVSDDGVGYGGGRDHEPPGDRRDARAGAALRRRADRGVRARRGDPGYAPGLRCR